jgi:hypothetical protein
MANVMKTNDWQRERKRDNETERNKGEAKKKML